MFRKNRRPFFAFLTILSFTFTQVCPAWALRPAGVEGTTIGGLEESLRGSVAQASVMTTSGVHTVWNALQQLEDRSALPATTRDIVDALLSQLSVSNPDLANRFADRKSILSQVDRLLTMAPGEICLTCGTHAVSNAAFSSPERQQPEAFQSSRFNEIEVLTAVLIMLDLINSGKVLELRSSDGHLLLANSMLSLKQALDMMQDRIPQQDRRSWQGAEIRQNDLEKLIADGAQVVTHLDGDHFVKVTAVEGGRVRFTEPTAVNFGGETTLTVRQFAKRWSGTVLTNGIVPKGRKILADQALLNLQGCCGINTVFGQYGGIRALLDALLRLKYRAPDNTGIAVLTENGIQVVRVGKDAEGHGDGSPDTMVAELYKKPIYPEFQLLAMEWGRIHGEGHELYTQAQEAITRGINAFRKSLKANLPLDHRDEFRRQAADSFSSARKLERKLVLLVVRETRLKGRDLFREEGLTEFVPTDEDIESGIWRVEGKLSSSYTLDNLFQRSNESIHVGHAGGVWAGDEYLIQHDNLLELVREISADFGVNAEFVRLFLRAELADALVSTSHARAHDAERIEEVFDRLSYSAVLGILKEDEQQEWDQMVMLHLVGRWLKVPPDFNVDAIRHSFRAQGSLIGMMNPKPGQPNIHPELLAHVEAEFERHIPGKGKQFLDYWKRERDLNQPGQAFSAINDAFHEWANKQTVDVWDSVAGQYREAKVLSDDAYKKIRGTGTTHGVTLRLIGELVVGHGRWAMTGDPSRWNAHPHESREIVIVHNGTIKPATNSELKSEHGENGFGDSYFDQTTPRPHQEIKTDTRIIVTHSQYLQDRAAADYASGRMGKDLIYADESDEGTLLGTRLEKKGAGDAAVVETKTTGRVRAWNAIVRNLTSSGRKNIPANEVAIRLAMTEMVEGSELGVSANSLHDPFVNYVISHDRPVDIVMYQGKALVTSDMAAGIALFPSGEVAAAARRLSEMHRQLQDELDSLERQRNENDLTPEEYVVRVKSVLEAHKAAVKPIKEKYKVDVYHLKELNKFAAVRRVIDSDGQIQLSVDISHLDGTPLSERERKKEAKLEKGAKVDPDVGIKDGYSTFIEKHVDEIPSILLDDAVSYIRLEDGRPARVDLPDLNQNKLTGRFGPKLEKLRRVFLVGVGSSWRDAKIVEQMFGDLLQGVELVQVLVEDPVEIQNLGIKLNPETDLAIGMSWSGSTASMVKLFNRLASGEDHDRDVPVIALTGKTSSDMASVAKESAGYVDVQSGPESSVATTKGFESVLYCLCLLGVQLSQMQGNSNLDNARKQYVQDLWDLVDQHMKALVREPGKPVGQRERSTIKVKSPDQRSKVQKVADAWSKRQKVLVIGSRANPVYVEGELKAEEIAWTVGKAVDIHDESWRPLLATSADPDVTESERVAAIFNMTDPGTLDDFMAAIREVTGQGIQVVVQAFRQDNPHYVELQQMEQGGKIALFEVPRVRTTLQALVDAIFYFQFAIAFARSHGLTDPQLDNPRNLAKSVTVSGARSLEESVRNSANRVVTVGDIVDQQSEHQRGYLAYRTGLTRIWSNLRSFRRQAGARLPLLLNSVLRQWFGKPSGAAEKQQVWGDAVERAKAVSVLTHFKQAANAENPTARILIVTDEESTQYAGEAAAGVYGSREVVVSGEYKDLYAADQGVKIRAGRWYYRASFDRDSGSYTLTFDEKLNPYAKPGEKPQDVGPIIIAKGESQITINGKLYRIDPSSFLIDKKETDKLVSGLQMRAEQPDLLLSGVENIRVVRVTDSGIDQLVNADTMVVLVSRAHNQGAANGTDVKLVTPDTRKGVPVPAEARSEQAMLGFARRLAQKGIPLVTITDDASKLLDSQLDSVRVTHLSLRSDFTSSSVYLTTYLALLAAGTRVGEILGRDTEPIARSLFTVPGITASVLGSESLQKQLEQVLWAVRGYKKVHIIGGGQSYADARELARFLSMFGIFAEAQLNDSAWHGPLASDDPNRRKYGEPNSSAYTRKYGVNEQYDTDGDVLVIMLATDSRFSDSAITDTQVYDSRNARTIFLTSQSNFAQTLPNGEPNPVRKAIIDAGPLQLSEISDAQDRDKSLRNPEGFFSVPDAPDILANFGAAVFGMMLADQFIEENGKALKTRPAEPIRRFGLADSDQGQSDQDLGEADQSRRDQVRQFLSTEAGRTDKEVALFERLFLSMEEGDVEVDLQHFRGRRDQTAVFVVFSYQDQGQGPTPLAGILTGLNRLLSDQGINPQKVLIDTFSRAKDGTYFMYIVLTDNVFNRVAVIPNIRQLVRPFVRQSKPAVRVVTTLSEDESGRVVNGDSDAETAFIAAMNRVLDFEHLPEKGDVANRILAGYRKFHETGIPQVFPVQHPSGEADHSILVAIDKNLPHLVGEAYVIETLQRNEGIDYETLAGQKIDPIAGLMVMDIKNVSADHLAVLAAKIQKSLRGANAPADFLAVFAPFEYQLPGSPLKSSVYAEFLLVREGAKVQPIISDYVPLRGQQNAFSVIFREETLSAQELDAKIRSAIARNGLRIEPDPAGNEMAFSVLYQGVRFMRYIVNSVTTVNGRLDERLLNTVAEVENKVKPPGASVILPDGNIMVLRDQLVEEMRQAFLADPYQGIHFKAVYDSTTNQTVLVVVAEEGQLNLVATVSSAMTEAGISLGKNFGPLSDQVGEDREYFIVPSEVPDAVIKEIQSELSATVTLHFQRAISQVLPSASSKEVSLHFQDFRSAAEGGVAFATFLDQGTSDSSQAVFSFAVRDLPATDPRLSQLLLAVRKIFELNELTVTHFVDFEYDGVRIFHVNIAKPVSSNQVQKTKVNLDDALKPFKAGLEENAPVLARQRDGSFKVTEAGVLVGTVEQPFMDLANGAHLTVEGGDSRIELAEGAVIEPNAVLVAPQGQTITIGTGTRILANAQIWGDVTIGTKSQIAGTVTGKTVIGDAVVIERGASPTLHDSVIGDGTKFTKGSTTVVDDAMLLPRRIRTRGPDGGVVEKMQPVLIKQTGAIERSVLWGTMAFQFSVILDSVMNFALAGNHVLISRSSLRGVSPSSRTAAAHYNYLISLFSVPLADRRDLAKPEDRATLRQELAALRFGVIEDRKAETLIPNDAHASRPVENLTLSLGDRRIQVRAKSSNLGAAAGTSNFDPRFEVKSPTLLWGAWAGVNAVFAAPTEIGPLSGVASQAQVKGTDALEPGTLVLPGAKGGIKEGYLIETEGRLSKGVETNVDIRLQVIRLLEIEAQVALDGLAYETDRVLRAGLIREAKQYQDYVKEARDDLERYLEIVGVSVGNLTADLGGQPADEKLQEQQRVLARKQAYLDVAREVAQNVAQALEKARTMANITKFRLPKDGIVRIERGEPGLSQDRVQEGLRRVRGEEGRRKPLAILFAAGAFSRFVDSVNAESPFFAQAARDRGLANSEGNASKLTAPMGVSGFGPILRILEGWAELGRRANAPVDVVIVDSAGNRDMLLRAINADRSSPNPRIPWQFLNILPEGIPVDQGEGMQVLSRDAAGQLQPVFEYNPATGRMDKPVTRPSGEFGAFYAGVQTARAAGVSIKDRDIVPIYADQSMLYSDPNFLTAVLAQVGEADITGLNTDHREVSGQWVPSGGVWAEARWPDGTTALVIAERNVRDVNATGVFNPRLDADERKVITASSNQTGFPYNAGAPIFSGPFVEAELSPQHISARLSTKKIQIKTGPGAQDTREVEVSIPELELTQAVQNGTQHPAGRPALWKSQMIVTGNWRYQGVKFFNNVQPGNEQIYKEGASLFTRLAGRSWVDSRNVEVAPGAGAFLGNGKIDVIEPDRLGFVQDRRGLWLYLRINPPAGVSSADLFSKGRLLIAADADGNIPLAIDMGVSPATYDDLPAQTGLEELTLEQIHERLQPLRDFFAQAKVQPTVLALDVDGVTTTQDGVLSDETRDALGQFIGGVPKKGGLLLLTDISPGQLRDRVERWLTPPTAARTVSFPLSGGEYLEHVIPDSAVAVLDRFVQGLGGKETVLRMDAKREEHAERQISDESLEHGFDINRTSDGRIVGIDIELNKSWLAAQAGAGQDPREGWVDRLQKDLRDANVGEEILQNLHPAGSGSLTWVPAKGRALIRWTAQQGINPKQTIFVDDSANHFAEFPDAARWGGVLVYIGKYDPSLSANVIQIGRSGEGKPANGPQIAQEIIRLATAGLEEDPLDTLVALLPSVPAISAIQNPQAYWLERMSARRISDESKLQAFLREQRVRLDLVSPSDQQNLLNLLDNYNALQQIFTQEPPKGVGLTREQVVSLIQSQADAGGTTFAQQVRGVLDVPDAKLPSPDAFSRILRSAGTLIFSGGNSGRAHLEIARKAHLTPVSLVPPDDDGGNYGEVRKLTGRVTLTGDTGNQRTNNASFFIRQVMADRTPEKPKAADDKARWESGETLKSLLLQEVATAAQSFEKQVQSQNSNATHADVVRQILQEPSLIRSLASFMSTHRIVGQKFPQLLTTKVPSKASGQNILGLAITLRSGLYDAATPEAKADALKRAVLLWNQALGLSDSDGLVAPASLDLVRLYFVYDSVTNFANAGDIDKPDLLKVTLEDGQLVLNDAAGRKMVYDQAAGAYVGRDTDGKENRFQAFPPQMERLIRDRIAEVGAISIVRGEDFASEEDTLYEGSQVIAWGAEFPQGQEPHASPAAQEIYQAVLNGETPQLKVIPISPGSEGTSIAPHFWRREMVEFLRELGQRRDAGLSVPRVVFTFNPTETNDSFGLGIPGQIRNHERIFQEVLNDPSVRFENLISEVVVFDHTDPWVTAPNPAVAREMGVSLAEVDYARILGPSDEEKQTGRQYGLVKKNRRATPVSSKVLADLRVRFKKDRVWYVPVGDVRGTVESSRGKISRSPRVLALTHRLGLILYPDQRAVLLPEAVREETRIYQEKHGEHLPTPDQLAEFLNKFGAKTDAAEVQSLMGGLEETTITAAAPEFWVSPDTDRLLAETVSTTFTPEVPAGVGEQGILPESDTAVATGVSIIAGPHASGLALGAAASKVTTRDGRAAAQVVFVVENAAEAELVNRFANPLMVFSASEYGGSLETALAAARDFLQGATELGTDNRPVPQTIQQILHNLFGIELAPDSMAIWNSFIERVTGALSTQL